MTQSYDISPSIPQGFERFGPWFSRTFQLWATHWVTWTLMTIIYLGISMLVLSFERIGPYLQTLVVIPLLMPGLVLAAIKMARGESFAVGDLFSGTRYWLGALVIGLVIGLGILVFGIGLLFTAAAFYLALPLLVDRNLTIGQALDRSWQVTKRDFGFFLVFALVMALLAALGALAFGIGLIFTLPWAIIAQAVAYTDTFPTWTGTPALDTNVAAGGTTREITESSTDTPPTQPRDTTTDETRTPPEDDTSGAM